jgi:hypothetical protein
MAHPRSACGARLHQGRRQRTGRAGSAAPAWRRPLLGGLLGLVLAGSVLSVAADDGGRTALPVLEPARAGTQCVEPPDVMRRNHMRFLKHQRDETVHGGVRGAKHSLKGCVDCHAGRNTASVAAAPGDFCVSCHTYAAVRIDCFECHASKAVAQARP